MKWISRTGALLAGLYLLVNYNWVHAASVAVMAQPCPDNLVTQARIRVADFYGAMTSEPLVRCVSGKVLGLNVPTGRANFAPGLPSVILIGPYGGNVDVIAHEMSHAEMVQRVGIVRRELSIPTWLDEGLAMQVDHRAHYNDESLGKLRERADLIAPNLSDLSNQNFFVAGDQGVYHYAHAKSVTREWIAANPDWLQQLTSGEIKAP